MGPEFHRFPTGITETERSGAVLSIPSGDLGTLRNRLLTEYEIEIPATRWDGLSFVRLSVQGYNTRADVDRLVEGLGTLLPEVTLEQ